MLIIDKDIKAFDLSAIHHGDVIRVKRAEEQHAINGIVMRANERDLLVLVAASHGNSTRYFDITALEVSAGVYELWWTSDFVTIDHYGGEADE
jgi:hypothetical protein